MGLRSLLIVLAATSGCREKSVSIEEESKDAFCEIRRHSYVDKKSSTRVIVFYNIGSRGVCRELEKRFEEDNLHMNLKFQCVCKPEAY